MLPALLPSMRTAAFVLGRSPFALAFRYCPSKSTSSAWPFACHDGGRLARTRNPVYLFLLKGREGVIPLPSVIVMVWPAGAFERRSIWPLGQRISRVSAFSLCARPKVKMSSLAERELE